MKAHSKALLDKAARNIDAAVSLLQQGFVDISVGRAYYAMFYCAEAALFERGLEFSSHGESHSAFGRELIKTGALPAALHRYLLDAFRDRQSADYDAPTSINATQAQDHIDHAKEFLSAVAAIVDG